MTAAARAPSARLALSLARRMGTATALQTRAAVRGLPRHLRQTAVGGAELTAFDPLDPGPDPSSWYARLHEGGPLHYNRRRGIWIVSRLDDVKAAARAHDVLSSAESVTPTRSSLPMMLSMDRPDHARLRKVVAPHFARTALERRRPAIERIVREAFEALRQNESADYVPAVSGRVPVEVIAELLGIPSDERDSFRTWADRAVEGFAVSGTPAKDLGTARRVFGATLALQRQLARALDERRRSPQDDLLSLLSSSSGEGRLDADELLWFAVLLLLAGSETTTGLLGSMALVFAEHPEQYERLRAEPELVPSAVEEALRYASPIQGFYRTALRDYPVGEAFVPAGGRVLLQFAAANRDPRRFDEPDRFLVDREPGDHMAFGTGIHFCLGAHLARMEGALVTEALLGRARRIELTGPPAWARNPALRSPASLPLALIA